jgi:hypothetical protein
MAEPGEVAGKCPSHAPGTDDSDLHVSSSFLVIRCTTHRGGGVNHDKVTAPPTSFVDPSHSWEIVSYRNLSKPIYGS